MPTTPKTNKWALYCPEDRVMKWATRIQSDPHEVRQVTLTVPCNMELIYRIQWNQKDFDYDTDQYRFKESISVSIQEIEPSITELETLHENVEPEKLQIKTHASLREFMEMVDSFMEKYIPERIKQRYMVQRYPTLRIVEPNQAKDSRLVFHPNGTNGKRTVWMPLTRCYDSNSIQFLSLENPG